MHRAHAVWRWAAGAALLAACLLAAGSAAGLERRKPQFLTEPAYLVIPFPYAIPGIGQGIAWTGLAANIADTNIDSYGILITGDAEGYILALEDMHIVPETLILNVFQQNISKAVVNNYKFRGMNSNGDSYNLIEVSQADSWEASLTLTLFERRLEFVAGHWQQDVTVPRVLDKDGNVIQELTDPYRQRIESDYAGALVDYTDDRQDPRKGVRASVRRRHSPPQSAEDPDYYVWDYTLGGYIPIGKLSTLLLYYFQSDAQVTRKGNTDPNLIRSEFGLGCAPTDQACLDVEAQLVQQTIDARTNGTSSTLGGQDHLRAYPGDRFQGAHTLFYAAEFRWNLTEESTPFDYFIWKDVRTNVQIAFFYELGSVGETRDTVGDTYRSSYGVGFRLVSGSGFVYRADIATGEEGSQTTVIFTYPF